MQENIDEYEIFVILIDLSEDAGTIHILLIQECLLIFNRCLELKEVVKDDNAEDEQSYRINCRQLKVEVALQLVALKLRNQDKYQNQNLYYLKYHLVNGYTNRLTGFTINHLQH